jgi:hypothetical protein
LHCGRYREYEHDLGVQESVKAKPKDKRATNQSQASPSESSELRGWPAIAHFLGMHVSTVHRWKKEGMPVQRQGRNVVASPEELNQWLQQTSGEAAGVHVVTPGSDLLKELRASVAAQEGVAKSSPKLGSDVKSAPKKKARSRL